MIQQIRKHPVTKVLSVLLIYCILLPVVLVQQPVYSQVGPSQTETSGYTLGSTAGMVDEFTGDFSYSIPLLDVDGYPITISYNSNVSMFQDASWVGLGWDLNVGSVSRDMRGIPDDFNGEDKVERSIGMKDYETDGNKLGTRSGISVSFADGAGGGLGMSLLYGTYMNSYNGKGTTWDFGLNGTLNVGDHLNFNWGVGFSMDSQNGVGRNNSIGIGGDYAINGFQGGGGFTASSSFSSRQGLKSTHFGLSHSFSLKDKEVTQKGNTEKFSGGGIGMSHGSSYSLGTMTSVPKFDLPRLGYNETSTNSLKGVVRLTAIQFYGSFISTNYYFNDLITLNKQTISSPAYGYFHLGKGQQAKAATLPMMDFNRERDSEFSEEMVKLPFSAPTYDFFNVSAMGIAGSVRGHRNDVGTLRDPLVNIYNEGTNKEVEVTGGFSMPNGLILGATYSQGDVASAGKSGVWDNLLGVLFRWNAENKNGIEKEVFFKAVGEPTPRDMERWGDFAGEEPLRAKMYAAGDNIFMDSELEAPNSDQSLDVVSLMNAPSPEQVRANYYRPYTGDVYVSTLQKDKVRYKDEGDWINPVDIEINRVDGTLRKGHHISAFEATAVNGLQYYFDVPVYNMGESEIRFNAGGLAGTQNFYATTATGNVNYVPGVDNSWNNARGRNGFYEKTTIPGYAHSHLLSLMTSSDYVDRFGDGPTADDMGNYYKFNYTRIYDATTPYKWRFPYEANSAKLNQGHFSTPFDDVASYSFGEKEVWYAHSIETKNYIVEFHLNDPRSVKRKDGHGVNDENGGLDSDQDLRYLEKIVLYNRSDRTENGTNAIPLKVISFKYDYSLCPGTPSNSNTANGIPTDSGKLTLKSIHFSGGNSNEGKLAPYEFVYDQGGTFDNPSFSYLDMNRWGGYKPNNSSENNLDYPFAEQQLSLANAYAKAWKLKKIITPSSGAISVEYEADRYTHTQDKKAMRTFKVLGMTTFPDFLVNGFANADEKLVNSSDRKQPFTILFFELDNSMGPITGTAAEKNQKITDLYFRDETTGKLLNELFFQFRVFVNPSVSDSYENILGFADIIKWMGVTEYGGNQIGYVLLKDEDIKDKEGSSNYKVNPIQKAAWQYARLNIPDVVYGNCNFNWSNPQVTNCDYSNDIDASVAFGSDLNKQLNKKGYCHSFDSDNSFIRLYDPRGYTIGGNSRVKSITYSDNWENMTSSEDASEYTWEYTYDHADLDNNDVVKKYTSGIAAYEPALGNVVNPFYSWSVYKNEIKQFPDETRFTVEPVGELLFPAPVVGYERVHIRFKERAGVTQNTVGSQETVFFTAKDKPTRVRFTPIDRSARVKRNNFFTSEEVLLQGLSQGYTVVTNDFHGKVKKVSVYDRDDNLIQLSNYVYDADNRVNMLDRSGGMNEEAIAMEYDIYADTRFIEHDASTMTIGGGIDLTWYIPLPILPMPIFNFSQAKTRKGFYAHTINKHLNRSAILNKVETTYLGSRNSAENLVWDRYSGMVIVSSLNDEFNDKLYSVSYPSHWYHTNFENRYSNEALTLSNVNLNNGTLTFSGTIPPLVNGDLVQISNGVTTETGWALTGGNGGNIINEDGDRFNTTSEQVDVKMMVSARKNRLTETMMQVTTKKNPVVGSSFLFPDEDILSVSAVEYDFNYDVPCPTDAGWPLINPIKINPFNQYGVYTSLYPVRQLAFQEERESVTDGIRKDAEIENYKPFYALNNGAWHKIYETGHPDLTTEGDYQKWRELQQITSFDEFAKPANVKDPLDVHAAVLYGYNKLFKLIPVASAVNAQTNQLVFEGFEEYGYLVSELVPSPANFDYYHFDFTVSNDSQVEITKEEKHSGLYSMKIEPGDSAYVSRWRTSLPCEDTVNRIVEGEYIAPVCDCIKRFSPYPGEYVLSTWVKQNAGAPDYADVEVHVKINGTTYTMTPSGPVIDGWQRVEGRFTVPAIATIPVYVIIPNTTSDNLYVDDFRIHPVLSEMTTTVYHPDHLLPIATHDGYNYTTFYNYDENRRLVRVRVETVEGVKTISETETGIRKRYTNN